MCRAAQEGLKQNTTVARPFGQVGRGGELQVVHLGGCRQFGVGASDPPFDECRYVTVTFHDVLDESPAHRYGLPAGFVLQDGGVVKGIVGGVHCALAAVHYPQVRELLAQSGQGFAGRHRDGLHLLAQHILKLAQQVRGGLAQVGGQTLPTDTSSTILVGAGTTGSFNRHIVTVPTSAPLGIHPGWWRYWQTVAAAPVVVTLSSSCRFSAVSSAIISRVCSSPSESKSWS